MARQSGGFSRRSGDNSKVVLLGGGLLVLVFSISLIFLLTSSGGAPEPSAVESQTARQAESRDETIRMVEVIVPLQEIRPGTRLEARMFRKEQRPQVGLSDRAVRSLEEIRGQFARSLIVAGQPLHRDVLTSVQPANQLTANIPAGYRAVTIRVDARAAVEGFVRPGTNVDVVWASNIRGRPGVSVIVQNAKVLSAERSLDEQVAPGTPVPSTVTLLVTSQDASKIQLASTTGSLSLSLRGDEDATASGNGGTVTVDDLYGGTSKPRQVRNREGTVVIGGKRYFVEAGKLVPAEETLD